MMPKGKAEGRVTTVSCAFMQNSLCLVLIQDWSFSILLYLPYHNHPISLRSTENTNSKQDAKIHMDSNKTQLRALTSLCHSQPATCDHSPSVTAVHLRRRRPRCRRTQLSVPGSGQPAQPGKQNPANKQENVISDTNPKLNTPQNVRDCSILALGLSH